MKKESFIKKIFRVIVVDTIAMIVMFNPVIAQITISTTPTSDCRTSDGKTTIKVTTTATGVVFEYSVDGGNFQSSAEFDNLSSGDHVATVRDKDTKCSFSKTFTIDPPTNAIKLDITGFGTVTACNNTSTSITLQATASGGSGNYEYTWPGGTLTVSNGGRYSVTATDTETGCKASLGGDVIFIPIVCARDPNDIIGPDGYGPGKMIAKSKSHPYKIRFENDPKFATAAAQVVRINHPLDRNINPFSLRLSDFGFNNMIFQVPADKIFYATRLNLTDSLGVVVDVTAGIDATKREAFWIFESKDQATGLPPADALLGLLPVNDSTGKGEGFVSYTIKAANHTVTGDSIYAKATIVFDINGPIETPEIFNTIDAVAPVSKIAALPPTSQSNTITLSWNGQDDAKGSGVRDYTLYVSLNGAVPAMYEPGITDTETKFTGAPGNTYSFFTLATDNVGNQETMKNQPEASILITGGNQTTYYKDNDSDGYGDPAQAQQASTPPVGYVINNQDCNDNDPTVYPGAQELCDNKDNNCNGTVDDGLNMITYYRDSDTDGFGDANKPLLACSLPQGYVLNNTDCNDSSNAIHSPVTYYRDADGDAFGDHGDSVTLCQLNPPDGYVIDQTDCDDTKKLYADNDGDGFGSGVPVACGVDNDTDCDDNNNTNHSSVTYYRDADGDGFGDPLVLINLCQLTAPDGYVSDHTDCDDTKKLFEDKDGDGFGAGPTIACGVPNNTDCDDGNKDIHSPVTYYQDLDGDGFGNTSVTISACQLIAPAGYVSDHSDCDDTKKLYLDKDGDGFGAGLPVACGVDNNTDCDDNNNSVHGSAIYYRDADGDGFGDANTTTASCQLSPPDGYVSDKTDCDDSKLLYADVDADGYGTGLPTACGVGNNTDCDDNNTAIHTLVTFYRDADGDGFGDANTTTSGCLVLAPAGYVSNQTDCDDTMKLYEDKDGDGFGSGILSACGVANNTDCNDNDNTTYPNATEICDGKDNNCSGIIDENLKRKLYFQDSDGDGYGNLFRHKFACSAPQGYVRDFWDCNDANPNIHPGAVEYCDRKDNDCDRRTDEKCILMGISQLTKGSTAGLVLKAQPNPSDHYFTLFIISDNNSNASINVFDVVGRVIETKPGLPVNSSVQVGQSWAAGVYYIEVVQNERRATIKLVKQ